MAAGPNQSGLEEALCWLTRSMISGRFAKGELRRLAEQIAAGKAKVTVDVSAR